MSHETVRIPTAFITGRVEFVGMPESAKAPEVKVVARNQARTVEATLNQKPSEEYWLVVPLEPSGKWAVCAELQTGKPTIVSQTKTVTLRVGETQMVDFLFGKPE